MTLAEGEHNITFFANDTSGNMGNFYTIYFTVDTSAPQNTTQGPSSANDTADIICYSRWTDNIGLDYGYLEHNATGTAVNSSQISLSGTSGWVNDTIDASDTAPGTIQCKAYVFDEAGLVNISTWIFSVSDVTFPNLENITYIPNTTNDLDPNIQVNITANISDNIGLDSYVLQYKLTNASSWTEKSMVSDGGNGYSVNFTPTAGDWSFRINATDTSGNINISSMTNISVSLDQTWLNTTTIQSTKTIVQDQSRIISLGNLTLNNTGDYDLNFTVSTNRNWITFNGTSNTSMSFIVSHTNSHETVNLTANTTGFAVGEYSYTISIESNSSYDESETITGTIVIQNVAGPYLVASIDTYDATVTQGDTGISLSSSVENVGTEDATETWLAWTLPDDWILVSGSLNRTVGFLGIGETATNGITVDIDSSAEIGGQTLQVDTGCAEGSTASGSKSVTVSASEGVTTTTVPSAGGGGGGGSALGGAGGGERRELLQTSETFEIVRGREETFQLLVTNIYPNSTLEDVTLKIEGYLEQYIEYTPDMITGIETNRSKSFQITITSPSYMDYGEYPLTFTITGKIVSGEMSRAMVEKRIITLILSKESKYLIDWTKKQF